MTDVLFFVELLDVHVDQRKVAVGNYWASSPQEAVDMAMHEYRGLFASMQTRSWVPRATQIADPERPLPVDVKST